MEHSCVRGWKLIWLVSHSSQQFQLNTLQSNCIVLLSSFGCSLYFNPRRRIGKMFVSPWSDNRTAVISGFIPAACPVVTLKRDSVLWHTTGKSHFLPVSRLFPSLLFLLSHDGSGWRTETGAKMSGALMGAEGWRAEACRGVRRWSSVWCDSGEFWIKEGSNAEEDCWKSAKLPLNTHTGNKAMEQSSCSFRFKWWWW